MTLILAPMLLCVTLAHADDDYLEPEAAFKFSARMVDPKTAEVTYAIADGYYMYRERFKFAVDGATLGEPAIPKGSVKYDETFQKEVETYHGSVTIRLPIEAAGTFTLKSTGQGCADKGLCYPPQESVVTMTPTGGAGLLAAARGTAATGQVIASQSQPAALATDKTRRSSVSGDAEMGRIEASLKSGKLIAILPLFLLLGLGLSFTPCVLPMVPILSFIIVGEGAQVRRRRGLILSATYSLGMAIVYTALGIAAGLVGEGLAAALQNPWVLGAFGVLMVALSLSMFGVYQLQVPAALQMKLMQASEKQAAGKLLGVFAMGAISALIVGPCVAAPLAGALVYISQTRDVIVGGSALFAMAVGMSIPLLLVGVSAGALLPRAGVWMEAVKQFFGVLMLGLALWMVSPIIPAVVQMWGWAALGVGYGGYLLWSRRWGWLLKGVGIVFAGIGAVQLVGAATGGHDVFAPLTHLGGTPARAPLFVRVKSTADLDAALAKSSGKPVMLDFYADWCVSCKEMEKLTFSDPRVQTRFDGMQLLQVDVTANDADDKAMLKRFKLFGPPGIIFFDSQGREIEGARVIGYQNADKFLGSLNSVGSL
ncbi:MAG TPA: protein-disulfide reductase DsbD [Paucimonas sp.]|nr:protein-disulfide reductase DsbD [Paucimonas sp.]HJW55700.1 protein-disulfide reductase DsbD [Burkholderiaceae bacterium]